MDGLDVCAMTVGVFVLAGAKGSKLRIERKDGMDDGMGVCGTAEGTEVGAGVCWLVLSDLRRSWDTRDVCERGKVDEMELREGRGVTTGIED